MSPETDCPPCRKCKLPCGSTLNPWDSEESLRPWLRCAACGEHWQASDEEWTQAERADAAWLATGGAR